MATMHMPAQAIKALGCNVLSWVEAVAMGAAKPCAAIRPTKEDVCTIMYTSGTTGG